MFAALTERFTVPLGTLDVIPVMFACVVVAAPPTVPYVVDALMNLFSKASDELDTVVQPVGASPVHIAIMFSGGVEVALSLPKITSMYGGSAVISGVVELTVWVCVSDAAETPELPDA